MPGRKFGAGSEYRYGFNGKENDGDIEEGALDYGLRIYDSRLGRFLSVDPLSKSYPFYTPYQFAGNGPITFIDIDGGEAGIPYVQQKAFSEITNPFTNEKLIRGQTGDKLGTELPYTKTPLQNLCDQLWSSCTFGAVQWFTPAQPFPYISQAINFASAIGTTPAYDYNNLTSLPVSDFEQSVRPALEGLTVYVQIPKSSETARSILSNLRSSSGLEELSDDEIITYISGAKILFEPSKDYSSYFWKKPERKLLLNQVGPTAIPLSPPSTIVLVPPSGTTGVNSPAGSVIVSQEAISQEMAATLAPGLVQMAKQKKKLLSDNELEKAQEQIEGIEARVQKLNKNKADGENKQNKIKIGKSKQRVKNALKNVRSLNDVKSE